VRRRWLIALAAVGLYVLAGWALDGVTGLVRTIVANTAGRNVLDSRRAESIDLAGIDPAAGGPAGVVASWEGYWEIGAAGLYDLVLESRGRSSWTIDGRIANEISEPGPVSSTRTVWLDAGFRRVVIAYDVPVSSPHLLVHAAETGRRTTPLHSAVLKPRLPNNPTLRSWLRFVHRALGWVALIAIVLAVRKTVRPVSRRWPDGPISPARRELLARTLAWTTLAGILAYGAILRLDAIAGRYGPVGSPSWLAAVQTRSLAPPASIRPASIVWELEPMFPHRDGTVARYRSDPHTYLDTARKMTWFYAAHPREPVFPYATKTFLRLLDWQDVAVSFASAFFSLLAVWFTYLLGAAIWSRPAGLLAALGLSIDTDVVGLASLGWRDDAYMAMAVLCAYLTLRWWQAGPPGTRAVRLGRLRLDATYLAAAAAGVAGGLACLTRITAPTFIAPGIAWLFVERREAWQRQLIAAALSVAVLLLVAGPFFVNCWRVLGDPFYAFTVHGSVYSLAEAQPEYTGGTVGYVIEKFQRRPLLMFDTVAQGLTTYPFTNKWGGLGPWAEGFAGWAAAAAIVGLAVLAAVPRGRLIIMMMIGSIVPFAFTWTVDPDYRFTVQAYPFLLIAAAVAVAVVADAIRRVLAPGSGPAPIAWWREPRTPWATTVGVAAVTLWLVWRVAPPLVLAETLRAREDATVTAGARDGAFFRSGWSPVLRGANVSQRMTAGEGKLSIRLPEEGDYPATLRMDPFPRPLAVSPGTLPVVEVFLNGAAIATIQLEWAPDRVGTYRIVLPRTAVRPGSNQLTLRVKGASDGDDQAISLWYLRVHPRQTASAIAQRRASPRAVRRPVAESIQMPSNDPMPQFHGLTTSSGSPR
jgi:hypothetical protein